MSQRGRHWASGQVVKWSIVGCDSEFAALRQGHCNTPSLGHLRSVQKDLSSGRLSEDFSLRQDDGAKIMHVVCPWSFGCFISFNIQGTFQTDQPQQTLAANDMKKLQALERTPTFPCVMNNPLILSWQAAHNASKPTPKRQWLERVEPVLANKNGCKSLALQLVASC